SASSASTVTRALPLVQGWSRPNALRWRIAGVRAKTKTRNVFSETDCASILEKWMAARLAPKKYGDRISHDVQRGAATTVMPSIIIRAREPPDSDVRAESQEADGVLLDANGALTGEAGRLAGCYPSTWPSSRSPCAMLVWLEAHEGQTAQRLDSEHFRF